MSLSVHRVNCQAYSCQKPGTSGLRKKTRVFMKEHYTESFVQSIFSAGVKDLVGSTLIVGGDGRFFCLEAAEKILQIAAANGVGKIVIGVGAFMSTPALSGVIRSRNCNGGIILTASHNPGGIDADFGIKFNSSNGGPASAAITDAIFAFSKRISRYSICPDLHAPLSTVGETTYRVGDGQFAVEVIDPIDGYLGLMKEIFCFETLRRYVQASCKVTVNALHGAVGPYALRVLCGELGVPKSAAVKCNVLPDFGGEHPDPNLTYASELVTLMEEGNYDIGVAFDGDGDRNMIIGRDGFFVSPCDSLAVLADNLDCIPYFKKTGVKGMSRSMPTSAAIDRVAEAKGIPFFEVPTGWKFFGNLMDSGQLSLCGEESFGIGSDHIREKDGLWALLAWLSVMAARQMGVRDILCTHWKRYGRNYFTRYDYESVSLESGQQVMQTLHRLIEDPELIGRSYSGHGKTFAVAFADDFSFTDPVDHSVAVGQGIRVIFEDGSRLVFRLSGTGSAGATVRVYVDSYERSEVDRATETMLRPLVGIALQLSRIPQLTGRAVPSVVT